MDLVAHCGDSAAGEFLHTLNVVDIDTRWTDPIRARKPLLKAFRPCAIDYLLRCSASTAIVVVSS